MSAGFTSRADSQESVLCRMGTREPNPTDWVPWELFEFLGE